MSDLASRVREQLQGDGPLARAWAGWQPRQGQTDMSLAVADVLEHGGRLAVEGAAGTGKTLAYLVPLLLSGQRAVISTATHALQEQLAWRDAPALALALGLPVRLALLKGRESYVCLYRTEQAVQAGPRPGRLADDALLRDVLAWALTSRDGDLGAHARWTQDPAIKARITSTSENCLRHACSRRRECHVYRARDAARVADWTVVNHHVLLSRVPPSKDEGGDWLSNAGALVVDEAHVWRDGVMQLPARRASARDLRTLVRDVNELGALHARGAQPWSLLALDLERAVQSLGSWLGRNGRREGRQELPESTPQATQAADTLVASLRNLHEALRRASETAPVMARLMQRVAEAFGVVRRVFSGDSGRGVTWLEWQGPLDWALVAWSAESGTASSLELPPSAVFTSATLGLDDELHWFVSSTGLQRHGPVQTLRVEGAIDSLKQGALHVPHDLPEPGDEAHGRELARRVAGWSRRLGGRTLVLTTTQRAARHVAGELRQWLCAAHAAPLANGLPDARQPEVLLQGQWAHRDLLARFEAATGAAPPAILVATGVFWRGIDLAGDALQLVVIDKLPFAPPDDPWMVHQSECVRAAGGDAFAQIHLAEAAMALRQGAGRLLRTVSDRGLLVVGDVRLLTRSYGPALLSALPPMALLPNEEAVSSYLDALVLTRASTSSSPPA